MHALPSSRTIELLKSGKIVFPNADKGRWVPVRTRPDTKLGFCDDNVAQAIKSDGGRAVSVWDVTEVDSMFLQLEAHIVWESPTGELVDVGPSVLASKKHFVIPAEQEFKRPFPGNVLFALSNDPKLQEFALHYTLAYAIIAPHVTAGVEQQIDSAMVRQWVKDFLIENRRNYDPDALFAICWTLLLERRG